MTNHKVKVKSNRLLFITLTLTLILFCATISSSEDIENIEYIGDAGTYGRTIAQTGAETGESILISIGQTHFDPLKLLPGPKAGLKEIQAYESGERGYYIVQFDSPVENSWKKALQDIGVDIFDYIPDFAFIIRMDSTLEQTVRGLPHVRWLGIYQPSYRISQSALDKMFSKEEGLLENGIPQALLNLTVFPGEDLFRIEAEIAQLNGIIIDTVTTKWKTTLKVEVRADRIAELSLIAGTKWIEPVPEWRLFNNVSTDVMNVRSPRDTYGLYGTGQTIGVCDTGLDQGSVNPANLHDDFEDGAGSSRVISIFDRVGDGASDVNSGHGTHVAGSVLGNGIMSGCAPASDSFPQTCFAGIAPKASLIFQAVEDNTTGYLTGLPSDLYILFSQADSAGADLQTNSWGSTVSGMYTSESESLDQYLWDHPDFLILFSAGNNGKDLDGDGVIDLYSMGSPATAKNSLTVGASEGNRPSGAGYDFPWGTGIWALEYSADPVFSDHVSDNPDGMSAFSSRGPVLDGRYKPDLVAPGTNILSVRSSLASGTGWGAYNSYYMWMGGTSMSTPLVAGAAALMREYLIDVKGLLSPSAALLKAALLNSAEDISPGQYGTAATQEIPDPPVPNNIEGWGRLNLGNGLYPAPPFNIFYHDVQSSLNTGQYDEYTVYVVDSSNPLKVNLVWTDYPGSPVTQGGLANDLDLQITDPSSGIHYPDNASQKSTVSTLYYDTDNLLYVSSIDRRAIRFTPSSYPANLESTTFYFYNPSTTTTDVDVVVYDDNGSGGLPGTELSRKTLTYVPTGWLTIGITGVVISSGDFYIAIEKNDTAQYIGIDDTNPTGRSYYHDGLSWTLSSNTAYIRANVRGSDYSTSFDRVNNVVGLTINSPATGAYTIRVSGYNIPQGPQPYALVVSGNIIIPDTIGVFRSGHWYLDMDGNGVWDGPPTDSHYIFGLAGDIPIAGDWDGTNGKDCIGVFRGGRLILDMNCNGAWDGGVDSSFFFGLSTDSPVVGDWNGDGATEIGVFRNGHWYLDMNGNGSWDGPVTDSHFIFGLAGDDPIAGDWDGTNGQDCIGVFRGGKLILDMNCNGAWDGGVDSSFFFGLSTDSPVVGDWNGDGATEIGVFRNGHFYLDMNGNGAWDGPATDGHYIFGMAGDAPITGRW